MRSRADARFRDRPAAPPGTAAPRSRNSSASRLRSYCKQDYRRTNERPINSLLIGKKEQEKREGGRRTHAGSRFQWQKPYLNSRDHASGGYSKPATAFRRRGMDMTASRRVVRAYIAAFVVAAVATITAACGSSAIRAQDLREWLTYIASDELEGRAVFSSGFGLAAAYIEDHLSAWGVKPAGDGGRYLQTVRVLGVKATSRASVTVEV